MFHNYEDDDEIRVMDLNNAPSARKGKKKTKKSKDSKTTEAKGKKKNRELVVITYGFLGLFLCLCIYFCYFLGVESETFINSTYNSRISAFSDTIIRGDILTSDGVVIVTTTTDSDGNELRSYPYSNMYAHAVGYSINGMSGVELDGNFQLLRSHSFILKRLYKEVIGEKNQGDSVVTTLDSTLQEIAYNGLGDYDGAVIAIEPSTGKILCMVSKPDFDPNTLSSDWDSLVSDDDNSALLNRAIQGLYPPGSTFKIITALEYLEEGGEESDSFTCEGSVTIDDYTLHCYKGEVHGAQSFRQAFANSCNVAFGEIGLSLDREKLSALTTQLLFNTTLPTALSNVKESQFTLDSDDTDALAMQTAIGQGETLVTPIHMAMIASAICNDGVLMEPYIIDSVQNDDGNTVSTTKSSTYGSILTSEQAEEISSYMRSVVTEGTGSKLYTDSYEAYGKTGTAEYSSDKDSAHSWFVGYATSGDQEIAIAVIMEGAGAGSSYAVPLAKTVFDAYFQN